MSVVEKQKNNSRVPRLRFPEFSIDWQDEKLGNMCQYKNGGAFENYISEDGKYDLINLNSISIDGCLRENHKKVKKAGWYLKKDDLVMVLSDIAHGNFLGLSDIIPENDKYVLNQRMGLLRVSAENVNVRFLRRYLNLNQKYFKKMGQGSSQQNLSKDDILKLVVCLPEKLEQDKISRFISEVDSWIENLKKQKEALEQYKKGVMQKIFSQEIRFKDDNGKDFPEWEEKRMEDIFEISTGSSKSSFIVEMGKNIIVDMGGISKLGELIANKHTNHNADFLTVDDLVMPKDDIGGGLIIGRVAMVPKNDMFVLGDHVFKLSIVHGDIKYMFHYINSFQVNKNFRRKANGTAQLGLSKKEVEKQIVKLPVLEEQKNIGRYLFSLGLLVTQVQKKIDQAEKWKKGLMQQLFV